MTVRQRRVRFEQHALALQERLTAERDALQAQVAALTAALSNERLRCAAIARRIGARREEHPIADRTRAQTADEIITALDAAGGA